MRSVARKRKHFITGNLVAVDTETTGLDHWHGDEPFAFSFCNKAGETMYFEWDVDPYTRIVIPDPEELELMRRFMEDGSITKIFHNAKFDIRMFRQFGIETKGVVHETMFLAHTFNSFEFNYKLKFLSKRYVGIPDDDEKDLKKAVNRARRQGRKLGWLLGTNYKPQPDGTWKEESATAADYWTPRAVDPEDDVCERYAVQDAERTMLLYVFYKKLIKERGDWYTYLSELELLPINMAMEDRGVAVNKVRLQHSIDETYKALKEQKKIVLEYTKGEINVGSQDQLRSFLYSSLKQGGLGLEAKAFTAKKKLPACNQEALEGHLDNPFVHALMQSRAFEKALTTFFLKFRKKSVVSDSDEHFMIHADFKQIGPGTGRYSCADPNLQNVTTEYSGRGLFLVEARSPFGPRPNHVWYAIDYSQLEVRIFADAAQEPTMLKAIADGRDMHTESAEKAWGGQGNESAIRAAKIALEMYGWAGDHTNLVGKVLKEYGCSHTGKLTERESNKIADDWLSTFDYRITDAEKSIDKKNTRSRAKLLIFTKVFGGGLPSVTKLLQCSTKEAASLLADYDSAFPRIKEYIRELSRQARKDRYVVNMFGRRIAVNDPDKAYRCVNYMVQGSAASLLKRAMVRCHNYLREIDWPAWLVMCIHDEIDFEFHKSYCSKEIVGNLADIMADHEGHFGVPTPVAIERIDCSWKDKKDIEWYPKKKVGN